MCEHILKNNKKPLFTGDQTPVLKTGTGILVNVEIKQYIIYILYNRDIYIIEFKDM